MEKKDLLNRFLKMVHNKRIQICIFSVLILLFSAISIWNAFRNTTVSFRTVGINIIAVSIKINIKIISIKLSMLYFACTCLLTIYLLYLTGLIKLFWCWFNCIFLEQIKKLLKWRLPHWIHKFGLIIIIFLIIFLSVFLKLFIQFNSQYFEAIGGLMGHSIKIFLFIFVIIAVEFSGRIRFRDNNEGRVISNLIFSSYYRPKLLGDSVLVIVLIILDFFCKIHPNSTILILIFTLIIIFLSIVFFDILIIFNVLTKSDFELRLEMILSLPLNSTDIVSLWRTVWESARTEPKSFEKSNQGLIIMNIFVSKILDQKNISCKRNIISVTNALKSFNENIDKIDIEPIKLEFIDISGEYKERMPEYFMKILKQRIEFTGKKFNVCELLSLPEMDYKIESPYYDITDSDDKFVYVDELLKTILESFAKIYKKLDPESRINMKKRFNELYGDKNILESVNKDRLIQELSRLTKLSDLLPHYSEADIKNNIENKTTSGKKLTLTESVVDFIFEEILEKSEKKKTTIEVIKNILDIFLNIFIRF